MVNPSDSNNGRGWDLFNNYYQSDKSDQDDEDSFNQLGSAIEDKSTAINDENSAALKESIATEDKSIATEDKNIATEDKGIAFKEQISTVEAETTAASEKTVVTKQKGADLLKAEISTEKSLTSTGFIASGIDIEIKKAKTTKNLNSMIDLSHTVERSMQKAMAAEIKDQLLIKEAELKVTAAEIVNIEQRMAPLESECKNFVILVQGRYVRPNYSNKEHQSIGRQGFHGKIVYNDDKKDYEIYFHKNHPIHKHPNPIVFIDQDGNEQIISNIRVIADEEAEKFQEDFQQYLELHIQLAELKLHEQQLLQTIQTLQHELDQLKRDQEGFQHKHIHTTSVKLETLKSNADDLRQKAKEENIEKMAKSLESAFTQHQILLAQSAKLFFQRFHKYKQKIDKDNETKEEISRENNIAYFVHQDLKSQLIQSLLNAPEKKFIEEPVQQGHLIVAIFSEGKLGMKVRSVRVLDDRNHNLIDPIAA